MTWRAARTFLTALAIAATTAGCAAPMGLPSLPPSTVPSSSDSTPTPRSAGALTVRICVLAPPEISPAQAAALVAEAWPAPQYGFLFEVISVTPWSRPGFALNAIWSGLLEASAASPADCERVLGLVQWTLADYAWSLGLPTVYGASDGRIGYARSTADVMRHELHHMLGCEHGIIAGPSWPYEGDCDEQIAKYKETLK